MQTDSYQIITDQIIDQLESGTIPWDKPFIGIAPRNYKGTVYRGINLLLLGIQGYKSPYWFTFNRVKQLGGYVKKGSIGTRIVFWKWVDKNTDENTEPGECTEPEEIEKYAFLRYYTVFNMEQTEGIDPAKLPPLPGNTGDLPPIEICESVVSGIQPIPDIRFHCDDRAFYNHSGDYIGMPESKYFKSVEGYYSTLFHELAHWTGHKSRLNRDNGILHDKHEYSKEELIAELASAFLMGHCGIVRDTIRNHSAYIQNWLEVFKGDKRILISAASRAQKATDYILGVAD